MSPALLRSDCPDLNLLTRGKVRDLYAIDDEHLLFVASDRISAFDVVMANGIPDKGKILTQLSLFWFDLLKDRCPNHLVTADINAMPAAVQAYRDQLAGRSMLVRRLSILPIEAIVRGYITGSGWKEYRQRQTVCDIPLPAGLEESQQLPEPLFTPSTKAEQGAHDENIHPDQAATIIGAEAAQAMAAAALDLYVSAARYARERGVIIADTKFEFGCAEDGSMVLADEVLTPDSSRFWPAADYAPGRSQASFDKQYVRDHLEEIGFDKTNPATLPEAVVEQTRAKYLEAFRLLTGTQPEL